MILNLPIATRLAWHSSTPLPDEDGLGSLSGRETQDSVIFRHVIWVRRIIAARTNRARFPELAYAAIAESTSQEGAL
jgi:hypothetical protein